METLNEITLDSFFTESVKICSEVYIRQDIYAKVVEKDNPQQRDQLKIFNKHFSSDSSVKYSLSIDPGTKHNYIGICVYIPRNPIVGYSDPFFREILYDDLKTLMDDLRTYTKNGFEKFLLYLVGFLKDYKHHNPHPYPATYMDLKADLAQNVWDGFIDIVLTSDEDKLLFMELRGEL